MAVEEPVGDLVDDLAAVSAAAVEAVADTVDEGAEHRREVTAGVALEGAPLALLRVELGAIPRQPDDVQPVGPLGEGGFARAARAVVARAWWPSPSSPCSWHVASR